MLFSKLCNGGISMDWLDSRLIANIPEKNQAACTEFLSRYVKRFHAQSGETIHSSGEYPQNLLIVEQGVLQSFHYTSLGEEFSASYYPPGDSIFHIALLTGNPVHSYCTAVCSADYVTIPKAAYLEAIDRFPSFQKSVLMHICITSEQLVNHFVIVQMKRPRYKICKYLLEQCIADGMAYTLPFNTEKFAVYLHLARPTLSKELHQMEDDGLIKLSRREIQILSMQKLCDELNS